MRPHAEYKVGYALNSIKCAVYYMDLMDKPAIYEDQRFMEMARQHLERAKKVLNADTEAEIQVVLNAS